MRKNLKIQLAILAVLAAVAGAVGLLAVDGRAPEGPSSGGAPAVLPRVSRQTPPAAVVALKAATNQTPTVRGTLPYVLTSAKPFNQPLRLAAEAMGAKTVCILDRNTVLVEATPAVRARLAADGRFRKVTEFTSQGKVQPALAALIDGGAEKVDVAIVSLAAEDRRFVQACLEAGGGEMLTGCINEGDTLRARLPAALVATLAARGDVRWMERFVRPQLMNDKAVQPEAMNVLAVWDTSRDLGLTGAGQKITTSDSGIDTGDTATMHVDLRNRVKGIYVVTGCDTSDKNGHGTHTAGSIVGDGSNCSGQYRGTAHAADLYAWFCGSGGGRYLYTPGSASDLFRPDGVEAYIHSASWGSDVFGQYTTDCVDYDRYVWQNPEFLPVFSAGNAGEYGSMSIGSPGSAKNVLTVGATKNMPNPKQTASFSSRGPCADGRTKPDIAAPGNPVTSTRSSQDGGGVVNGYTSMSGTSMSCPLTAGSVVLVRQWLVEKKGFEDVAGKRPTAALMKAVITGGAKGGVSAPSNSQGWGRVDLADTLAPTDGRDVLLVDRLEFAQDEVFEYLVQTTNAAPLDVQLCWVDYQGSASGSQAAPRLINDLDLTVESLDGASGVLLGNGGKTADTVNNMESVRIATAAPSRYLITVKCSNIVYDYTIGGAAALYVRGAFDPSYEPSGLERVRIQRTPDVRYKALDTALADVQDGDVVEVLDAVTLREPMTLTNSFTICATNAANPAAAKVTANGTLTLDEGARVLFTNVVFTGVSPALVVGDGCTAALGGTVGLDRIVLEGSGQVELVGALDDGYAYRVTPSEGHSRLGETFGRATVDLETARGCANLFVNADESELIGEAFDDGNGGVGLRWVVGDVPEAAAVARLNQNGISTRFADMKVLMKYLTNTNDAEIVILKDCVFDGVIRTGAHALTIRSESGLVLSPKEGTTVTTNAFVVSEGGLLSVSNVVFSGFAQFGDIGAFVVVDEGGRFEMLPGAEIRDIYNAGSLGAVYVIGEMSMTNGARIVGCASDNGRGGGVYLRGALDFCGAEITGCRADDHGGGIYVEADADLTLSGAARIVGNVQRGEFSQQPVADDIYIGDSAGALPVTVANVLPTARIGVHPSSCDRKERDEVLGEPFAALAGAMSQEMAAAVFFNDVFNDYYTGLVGGVADTGDTLVWAAKDVKPGSVPESEGLIAVDIGGVTNHYRQLSYAFASVADGETARVLLLTNVLMDADITVKGHVTLDGSDWVVYQGAPSDKERMLNAFFTVSGAANSLVLTNVCVTGCDELMMSYFTYGTLFKVNQGGALTLEKGALVSCMAGSDEEYSPWYEDIRAVSAILVEDGGQLTMRSGSTIDMCVNEPDEEAEYVGGAVAATGEGTVFRMEGGRVIHCNAFHGGGVDVENGAEIRVSGDAQIVDNKNFSYDEDNLYASDGRRVVLTDIFTGRIGYTLGATKADSETNVFGTVVSSVPLEELANGATNFYKDVDHAVTGRIVTNATDALLVWSSAVSPEGVFTDKDGNVYGQVRGTSPTPPGPTPEPVVTNWPSAIAFKSITRLSETEWALVVTDRVEHCRYRFLSTDDLTKGFVTTGDWAKAEAPGPWETNVTTSVNQLFWKAEATWGIVPKDE